MIKWSDKIVRCNFCLATSPREPEVEYCHHSMEPGTKAIKCPKCNKGHLWLFNIAVNEEQLKKDKHNRENPSHGEKVKNAIHLHEREYTKPEPPYGTKLGYGFEMMGDNDE